MKQIKERVISNDQIAQDYYRLVFTWNPDAGIPEPGQFITLRVTDSSVPLLRRPFAFSGYSVSRQQASIIYLKRGTGTEIMAGYISGDTVDIIGPLGNYLRTPLKGKKPILLAGGIGLGPLLFYSTVLEQRGIPHEFIFGTRSKRFVPDMQIQRTAGSKFRDLVICTDDGSIGYAGTVVDYVREIPVDKIKNTVLYCCGPHPMLKLCHGIAELHNFECYVVMEQIMACGVGACMGCTVKIKKKPGYARVCTEGPVFRSRDVIWT